MPQKLLAGLAALVLTSGFAFAQKSEQRFITKAAMGGMAEVQLGQLATEHASNESVKHFGQRMVDDHSKANEQLKQVAAQKSVPVPASLNGKHQALYDRLSKLKGAEFDRAYMAAMVKDHKEDVEEFRKASQSSDPEVKQFASETLPTLEEHLKMAEETNSQLGQ